MLVLKDKKIGEAGDDIDELVNEDHGTRRADKQQLDKDNERRKGRAWDDDADGGRVRGCWASTTRRRRSEGIVIGGGGVYGTDEEEKRRRRKRRRSERSGCGRAGAERRW